MRLEGMKGEIYKSKKLFNNILREEKERIYKRDAEEERTNALAAGDKIKVLEAEAKIKKVDELIKAKEDKTRNRIEEELNSQNAFIKSTIRPKKKYRFGKKRKYGH